MKTVTFAGKYITFIGEKGTYLRAWKIAQHLSKLTGADIRIASNSLFNSYFVGPDAPKVLPDGPLIRAREILAYPEPGGVFRKGYNAVDAITGDSIPASCIPPEAFNEKGVGLYLDPQNEHKLHGKMVYEADPSSVIVIRNFIQISGRGGKAHEIAKIPVEVPIEVWNILSEEEKAWLCRIAAAGVRPIVRGDSNLDYRAGSNLDYCYRGTVFTYYLPTDNLSIALATKDGKQDVAVLVENAALSEIEHHYESLKRL